MAAGQGTTFEEFDGQSLNEKPQRVKQLLNLDFKHPQICPEVAFRSGDVRKLLIGATE